MIGPLCFEGDDFYDALHADLAGARRRVWLEFYIFRLDRVGRRVLRRLRTLADRRGVEVRLLLDGIGSRADIEAIRTFLSGSSVELQVYKPVTLFSMFRSGMHRRNHRKLVLIDGRVCWIGGINIKEEISMHWHGSTRWRDTMLRIQREPDLRRFFRHLSTNMFLLFETVRHKVYPLTVGNVFQRLSVRNLRLLAVLRRHARRRAADAGAALSLHTTILHRERARFRRDYMAMLRQARQKILLCTPYFVVDRRLVRLLCRKAQSGVDVRLMTAGTTDVWSARQAGRATYARLLRAGVQIYEFQGRIFHAKQTLADDRYYIGSGNFDFRSFLHNQETMVLGRGAEMRLALEAQWNRDANECHRISVREWKRRSMLERITERMSRAFRYYL